MNRTSRALKRLGVPVLTATTLLTAGQFALGTSAFAAVANGTLTITPNPGAGSATPVPPATGDIQQTVTYTPGTQSVNTGAQTITITVNGSATIVNPTPNTQPQSNPAPAQQNTLVIAGNGKSATCTTTTAPPNPNPAPAVVQGCNFAVHDILSEAVTVTATDSTDQTTPPATATDNFAALSFTGCATIPNTAPGGNCTTQQGAGTSQTYTVTYLEAGAPAVGKEVDFHLSATGSAIFPTAQTGNANTTATGPADARCTTDANGHCSVTVAANGGATGNVVITATTANTAPYPPSQAQEQINFIASTTPGRFVQTSTQTIRPTPNTPVPPVNEPGDVVQNTYTLSACQANSTSGQNVCLAGQALAGQSVSLTVDHGFFTPVCTHNGVTNYANCTFNTTPTSGTPVGDLKSLGTTTTATTDANGQLTVALGIARDQAFDTNGNLVAQVTAVASGVTLVESVNNQSASGTTCNAPGSNPQAGCPTGTSWTTNAAPLNGGTIKIVSVPNPANTSEPTLSNSTVNNVPNTQNRVFVLRLTDQFGNLTSGGAASGVTLTKTGVGDLWQCFAYDNTSNCTAAGNNANTNTTDATGSTTSTYNNARGSYLGAFQQGGGIAQTRYVATAQPFNGGAPEKGTQTDKASWAAPTTTFNTFLAGPPAVATYNTGTVTMTDTVTINFYSQTEQPVVTFSTTPSNHVAPNTVVTVVATVKDQFGQPVQGDTVQFFRSGPTTEAGTSCTQNQFFVNTDKNGQAGFSFTCSNASVQHVTIVISDPAGKELARGVQNITFGTPTSGRITEHLHLACISKHPHVIKCVATASPVVRGATVTFFNKTGHRVGRTTTNRHGKAFLFLHHKRSGKTYTFQAQLHFTAHTTSATSRRAQVTVQ